MRLKKAILHAKRHYSPDGVLDITPARLKHWASTFRRMKAADLQIPVSFDHSNDPSQILPVQLSANKDKKRTAENAVGWLDDFKIAPGGRHAELTLEIPDEKAAAKAESNVVELSPIICREFKDGANNVWSDCITHADLVLHPVEHGQGPFVPADQPTIACSLRMGLDVGKPQIFRMADDDNPFKKKKDGDGDGETNEGADDDPAIESSTDESTNPDLPKEVGTDVAKQIEAVVAHLALMTDPIVLPSDTDDSNFFDRLLTALMTAKAAKDAAAAKEAEEDKDDHEDDDMANATEQNPQFAAMSLKAEAAHNYAEGMYRGGLKMRLDALLKSGRCTPAEKQAQEQLLGAVRLSLGANQQPEKSTLELWMESRESLPAGAAWKSEERIRMATEVKPPEFAKGEESHEEAEEIVDQMFKKPKRQTAAA